MSHRFSVKVNCTLSLRCCPWGLGLVELVEAVSLLLHFVNCDQFAVAKNGLLSSSCDVPPPLHHSLLWAWALLRGRVMILMPLTTERLLFRVRASGSVDPSW